MMEVNPCQQQCGVRGWVKVSKGYPLCEPLSSILRKITIYSQIDVSHPQKASLRLALCSICANFSHSYPTVLSQNSKFLPILFLDPSSPSVSSLKVLSSLF